MRWSNHGVDRSERMPMQKSRPQADGTDSAIRMAIGGRGGPRAETLAEVLEIARTLLAGAPVGMTAEITACLGAPLCELRDAAPGHPRTCDRCECLSLDENGALSWPRAGNA